MLTAFNFRQSHREEVRAAIHEAAEAGLGVIAMKTQAGVYWDAMRPRKINMKAALRWVLRDEHVHSSVPAFSNYDELEEDLAVARDPALRPEEERDLRLGERPACRASTASSAPPASRNARRAWTCPLMRGYMYAVGHGRPRHARHLLRRGPPSDIPCTRCGDCRVHCALGFDVRARARDLARLMNA